MTVYHGSFLEVSHPDLQHSRKNLDFGTGFYVTPFYEQAVRWCERFKRKGKSGIVSHYNFDERAYGEEKIRIFETYSEEWLDFILTCRRGLDRSDYTIVVGGVANDRVFNTVELYFDHLIDKVEAIRRLQYEKPNMQICFRTESVLKGYLRFEKSEII